MVIVCVIQECVPQPLYAVNLVGRVGELARVSSRCRRLHEADLGFNAQAGEDF
jgi:hypothetical protein